MPPPAGDESPDKDGPNKSPADFPELFDIDAFNARLQAAFERVNKIRPYRMESLGQVDGRDIFLLSPLEPKEDKPSILTAGGFHGEEPAGPWGIVEFLETADAAALERVNHSFLPLVNPTGFERAVRFNIFGENPNRGYVADMLDSEDEKDAEWTNRGPSAEGKILLAHRDKILALARDGFASQHEDDGLNEGFIFINENGAMPSPTATALLEAIKKYFPLIPDGGKNELAGAPIRDGMWINGPDSSFEWRLFLDGVPRTVTTETPSLEPARARVDCNRELVKAFAAAAAKIGPAPPKAEIDMPQAKTDMPQAKTETPAPRGKTPPPAP